MPALHRRWTADAVRTLTDDSRAWPRYELIRGELLVTPAPRASHQFCVLELARALADYVDAESLGATLTSPSDLELRPDTVTQPDVFVVPAATEISGELLQWPDIRQLLLAVEVLSPGSTHIDRVVKRDFYLDSGVDEYWIVDLDARVIEVWTPDAETPVIVRDRMEWLPVGAAKPLILDVRALIERGAHRAAGFRRRP